MGSYCNIETCTTNTIVSSMTPCRKSGPHHTTERFHCQKIQN